jgi:SAM-dependent methyltransferase
VAEWWEYDELPSGEPYSWGGAARGDSPFDNLDFHLDIGCGTVKKGRLGIDRHAAPGVDLLVNFETLSPPVPFKGPDEGLWARTMEQYAHVGNGGMGRLPFPDNSIESIISHHCLEHVGEGFVALIDECYRILKPGGVFRVITPLFPSRAAVEDPDHRRWIMEDTFDTFVGSPDGKHWHEGFSVPYTKSRFEMADKDFTALFPPEERWTHEDRREIRVALRKWAV